MHNTNAPAAAASVPVRPRLPFFTVLPLIVLAITAAYQCGRHSSSAYAATTAPASITGSSATPVVEANLNLSDPKDENLRLHQMIFQWGNHARHNGGKTTITTSEIKELGHLANDACRP